ncbi:ETC complex I subunit [Aestuariivirga sp.]|uniref:ETC complex I subunit n=1 Tax=Aestuariivirga sp. TaxID=2650926 RepID=UPI003BAA241D
MPVRIFKPSRNAMQSGKAKYDQWLLQFEAREPRTVDPLMGWTSSADTRQQLTLSFDTKEEAIAYCEREGLAFTVLPEAPAAKFIKKSYSDNFKFGRSTNWTH